MQTINLIVEDKSSPRIDAYIAQNLTELSRAYIQRLIKDKNILVNSHEIKSNYKLKLNDNISILIPDNKEPDIVAKNIPLNIVYEDNDIIVLNKDKNMVVHPAPGHYDDTLVNGLMFHCKDNLSGINGVLRPGIVHRIDMNTTGIIIACKNDSSHKFIARQLKEHSITRKYRAIVHRVIKDDFGTIDKPIARNKIDRKKMAVDTENGKQAVTHYKVLKRFSNFTYIECSLETGRTHQIRVHMASINHPILGDDIYSHEKTNLKLNGQTLHAMILGIIHPSTKKYMEFKAELPDYFSHLLDIL